MYMFLAWKEIEYFKTRYALVIGILILVSFLVFFLTGLAFGLSQDNRIAIDGWEAEAIVLTNESNTDLNQSSFPLGARDDITGDEIADLAVAPVVLNSTPGETEEDTEDVSEVIEEVEDNTISAVVFGIDSEEFIMPEVIEGEAFEEDFEVIADISLQEEYNIQIGDELSVAGDEDDETIFKIKGFTENAKYNVQPVLYTSIPTAQEVRYGEADDSEDGLISAFIVRDSSIDDIQVDNTDLSVFSMSAFIQELPGYMAQLLTFGLMIIFLIVIAAIIIGIFMYVLTVQKKSMFGVMKAQGISTGYIGKYVVIQTFLLSLIGVATGLFLTLGASYALPSTVPFFINWIFMGIISVLILIFAVLGSTFSVIKVAKIDPLEAIG